MTTPQLMLRLALLHLASRRTAEYGYDTLLLPPWGQDLLDAEIKTLANFGAIAARRVGVLGATMATSWAVSHLTPWGEAMLDDLTRNLPCPECGGVLALDDRASLAKSADGERRDWRESVRLTCAKDGRLHHVAGATQVRAASA